MIPQLSTVFGAAALGIAAIVGMFYYRYSPFSLVAGAAMAFPPGVRGTLVGATQMSIANFKNRSCLNKVLKSTVAGNCHIDSISAW